jgi:hypothetical protein
MTVYRDRLRPPVICPSRGSIRRRGARSSNCTCGARVAQVHPPPPGSLQYVRCVAVDPKRLAIEIAQVALRSIGQADVADMLAHMAGVPRRTPETVAYERFLRDVGTNIATLRRAAITSYPSQATEIDAALEHVRVRFERTVAAHGSVVALAHWRPDEFRAVVRDESVRDRAQLGGVGTQVYEDALTLVIEAFISFAPKLPQFATVMLTVNADGAAGAQDAGRALHPVLKADMESVALRGNRSAGQRPNRLRSQEGARFYGRRTALARIDRWLTDPEEPPVLVVTGGPGVGKTALLNHVVATTDPASMLSPDDDPVLEGRGTISVVVDASGKTSLDVAQLIGRAVSDVPIDRVAELGSVLYSSLHGRAWPFTVVLDGLDESSEAEALISDVLIPLARTAEVALRVRLLIGARSAYKDLIGSFSPRIVIDLDTTEYFEFDDLVHSVEDRLRIERNGNPYRDSQTARPIATRIAQLTEPNYLVALLTADNHSLNDKHPVRPENIEIPGFMGLSDEGTAADIPESPGGVATPLFHASAVSDAASLQDRLGFAPHVDALARVVAARSTEPPLAIALLADWGSGKSSFMAQLAGQVDRLAIADGEHFVRKARVVTFNAWHYHGERSVLVGMMTQVFRALQRPAKNSRERLREPQDGTSVDDSQAIERRRVQAKRRAARLEVLQDRVNLSGDRSTSADGNTTSTMVSRIFAQGWALVYLPWAVVQGRATVVIPAALGIGLALAVAVTQVVAPDLVAAVMGRASTWWSVLVTSSVGMFVSLLWTAVIVARRWVVAAVDDATSATAPIVTFVQATVVQELKASEVAYEDARAEDALARLGKVLTQAETSLGQHRGVIGVVQDEIEALATAVEAARRHAERLTEEELAEHLPDDEPDLHVDRVILHVDDLDRCPPARVVDVLEAVALLQSTSLFIVVVSVDPRWLRKSLEHHENVEFAAGEVHTHLNSRVGNPLDYLDKIFQIPFTIPRLQASASRAFLLEVAIAQKIITDEIRDRDPWDGGVFHSEPTLEPAPGTQAPRETLELAPAGAKSGGGTATRDGMPAAVARLEASELEEQALVELAKQSRTLDLTAHEVHYLAALTGVLSTPRAVKRLLNLYQLLRLGRHREDHVSFAEPDGPYKEASLLMALLVGAPDEAAQYFRHLDSASDESDIAQVLAVLSRTHAAAEHEDRPHEWCQSCDRWEDLSLVVRAGVDRGAPANAGPYRQWTREVSRFSFHTTLLRSRPVRAG